MKKVLALVFVLVMCFSFVACEKAAEGTDNPAIVKYVDENRAELLSTMETSFAGASGMSCESNIYVEGDGFVIDIDINGMSNVDDATKELLQETYDTMDDTFDLLLANIQKELPECEYFTINVCDENGEVLAVIDAGK